MKRRVMCTFLIFEDIFWGCRDCSVVTALLEDRDFISRTRVAAYHHEYTYFICVYLHAVCMYVHVSCMWMYMKNRRLTTAEVTVPFYPPDLFLGTNVTFWKTSKSSDSLSHFPSYCMFLSYQWNKSLSISSQNLFDHVAQPNIVVMCQLLAQLLITKDNCFLHSDFL